MSKALILGASSFVGKNLLKDFDPSEVDFTFNSNFIKNGIKFNAVKDNISTLPLDFKNISHAVILIGDTEPDSCYFNSKASYELNVINTIKLIDFLYRNNIKIIFCSTEFVFDGKRGMYTELDTPKPILEYGCQKYAIETYLKKFSDSTILRFAKVYGEDPNDGSLFSDWRRKIENNEMIECANDQYFSPIFVNDISKIIKIAIKKNVSGLFNISCGKKYSRLELLELLLEHRYDNTAPKIITKSIDDFDLPEVRPKDVSMNSEKAQTTFNFNFTTPEYFLSNSLLWKK